MTGGDVEEMGGFWSALDRIVDGAANGYTLGLMGYLNGWVGDTVNVSIIDVFGVPEENDNGRRLVDFCAEKG